MFSINQSQPISFLQVVKGHDAKSNAGYIFLITEISEIISIIFKKFSLKDF